MAHLKVLVKGSIPSETDYIKKNYGIDYKNYKNQFIAACNAIGKALAHQGHTIMVGVPDWSRLASGNVAVNYVLDGAISQSIQEKMRGGKIIFHGPKEPEPPDQTPQISDTLQDYRRKAREASFNFEDRYLGNPPWAYSMYPDVFEADVVIIIAGANGTTDLGRVAFSISKPIIAICSFTGAAQILMTELLSSQYDHYCGNGAVTPGDIRALSPTWSTSDEKANFEAAQMIVTVTEKLVIASQKGLVISRRMLLLTVLLNVFFVGLWVFFFLTKLVLSNDLVIFILLYISALIGTGLRNLVGLQSGEITGISSSQLILDIGISVVVAFGLALVYLIGGISMTGGEVVIMRTDVKDTFSTIAISMSLLGLAAGYLQPLKQLQERLEQAVETKGNPSEEKKG